MDFQGIPGGLSDRTFLTWKAEHSSFKHDHLHTWYGTHGRYTALPFDGIK
jgi:hypothetical protein